MRVFIKLRQQESFLLGKTPPAGGGGTQVPKGERLSAQQTERSCRASTL